MGRWRPGWPTPETHAGGGSEHSKRAPVFGVVGGSGAGGVSGPPVGTGGEQGFDDSRTVVLQWGGPVERGLSVVVVGVGVGAGFGECFDGHRFPSETELLGGQVEGRRTVGVPGFEVDAERREDGDDGPVQVVCGAVQWGPAVLVAGVQLGAVGEEGFLTSTFGLVSR